jgi:hypothetical protein
MKSGLYLTLIKLRCSAASEKGLWQFGDRVISFLAICVSWLKEQKCLQMKLPTQYNVTNDREERTAQEI